jgi:alkaline phosphatase
MPAFGNFETSWQWYVVVIDSAAHANNIDQNIFDTMEFSHTIQLVLDWAADRDDTLIILTADHETGGLSVIENNGQGNFPTVSWSTGGRAKCTSLRLGA